MEAIMDKVQELCKLVKFGEADDKEILGNIAVLTTVILFVLLFTTLNCKYSIYIYQVQSVQYIYVDSSILL